MENLEKRGVTLSNEEKMCRLCTEVEESSSHLFFHCKSTTLILQGVLSWLGVPLIMHPDPKINFLQFSECLGMRCRRIRICVVWQVWTIRNEMVFQNASYIFL